MRVFIDSHIPMYVAGVEHPNREPAHKFLEKVHRGEVEGCCSTEVLREILGRYTTIRRHDYANKVYDIFVRICPVIFSVTLADTDRARELLLLSSRITAREAMHAAVMLNQGVEWIASFDKKFDRIPGVRRVEL
ncbi:MAG: type II toxin-antitoxin system VapC family toxin [Bryobacterales bacterium]